MRLSWQPLWVEWENNVSCSHVILQVKIGLTENIMFKRKVDLPKGTDSVQISYFANHLCSSPYPPFLKQCMSFPWPKAKLEWEKMEKRSASWPWASFTCMSVHERWQYHCQMRHVPRHDLSLVAFFVLWCGLE